MFSRNHEIWQFAYAGDELDDWLPYAEDLIRKWSTQSYKDVKFQTTFEIIIAALLLKDDLLPASARTAFAEVMLITISEASENKLHIAPLHIHPPKPGRKKNLTEIFIRCREVKDLLQQGITATEAYKVTAEKHFKSPDTIRREYERMVLKRVSKK